MQFDISGSDPFSITPSDSVDLTKPVRGVSITVSGTIKITKYDGSTDTLTFPAGGPFPMRAQRVWATGTTATGLVGFP